MTYIVGHYTAVGHYTELDRRIALLVHFDVIAHVVIGVVRHHERCDLEESARDESLDITLDVAARGIGQFLRHAVIAFHSAMYSFGGIDRDMVNLAYTACRTDMIGVIVGDEQSHDLVKRQSILFEVLLDGAHRNACIDKYCLASGFEVITVAAASARQTHEFDLHQLTVNYLLLKEIDSLVDKEDGWHSRNLTGNDIVGSILRYELSPFRHRARHDFLICTCDVGGKADARLWSQGRE